MKIDSIQMIPMNKKSIFGDEYRENETAGITYDFQEWANCRKEEESKYGVENNLSIPKQTAYMGDEEIVPIKGNE